MLYTVLVMLHYSILRDTKIHVVQVLYTALLLLRKASKLELYHVASVVYVQYIRYPQDYKWRGLKPNILMVV